MTEGDDGVGASVDGRLGAASAAMQRQQPGTGRGCWLRDARDRAVIMVGVAGVMPSLNCRPFGALALPKKTSSPLDPGRAGGPGLLQPDPPAVSS